MGVFILKNKNLSILNTEYSRFSENALEKLNQLARIDNVNADRNFLIKNISKYDIIFIALNNIIDEVIITRAKKLKCIVTPTTGLDHIDVNFAKKKNIDILSLKDEVKFLENITSTAEHSWALLLSIVRDLISANSDVVYNKNWVRDHFYGNELQNKTLGIAGYGRLGKIISRYAKAFGMSVIVFDKNKNLKESSVEFVSLEALAKRSDFITIHLSLNNETKCIFDKNIFSPVSYTHLTLPTICSV